MYKCDKFEIRISNNLLLVPNHVIHPNLISNSNAKLMKALFHVYIWVVFAIQRQNMVITQDKKIISVIIAKLIL